MIIFISLPPKGEHSEQNEISHNCVYGMSQYADGGLITTKPYISSSNYIRKIGDFSEGE